MKTLSFTLNKKSFDFVNDYLLSRGVGLDQYVVDKHLYCVGEEHEFYGIDYCNSPASRKDFLSAVYTLTTAQLTATFSELVSFGDFIDAIFSMFLSNKSR